MKKKNFRLDLKIKCQRKFFTFLFKYVDRKNFICVGSLILFYILIYDSSLIFYTNFCTAISFLT